jgi:hypothetical protein
MDRCVRNEMSASEGSLQSDHEYLRGLSSVLLPDGEPYWFNNPQYR